VTVTDRVHTDVDADIVDRALASLADDGVAVVADVLSADEAAHAFEALLAASDESERRGVPKHIAALDPNAANVRVFNLIDLDDLFGRLIAHPIADAIVTGLLGRDYIVSNFSANIARPGSESMVVHSDLGAVMPEPWTSPLSCNVIWCLTDVHPDNGATLHIPGSHRYRTAADVPDEPLSHMVPFEATAGSVIVMDGRVWHTSGRNVTSDEDRALLFGYYTTPFLRPQWNFTASLRPEVQAAMPRVMRYRLGLDTNLNMPSEAVFGDLRGTRREQPDG
jgi:ectoine hydroxylase-related dioxygenase (phytanoyl-CoA dioxygenase family)